VRRLDDGAFAFTAPERRPIWLAPPLPPGDVACIERENDALGLRINHRTCIPDWYGEKMSLADAVMLLCLHEDRRREQASLASAPPRTG